VICFRLAGYATPLRTVPASQPARYNLADDPLPTQYLSLHPLGPLAELVRNHDLRTPEQMVAVRARTWALRVELAGLTELTFDNAATFGLSPADLVADDRTACQELALRVRGELPGLIVPSAALPGTRNAVLFGARVAAPYLAEPLGLVDVPASITADGARPPLSLLDAVRFRRQPHRALDAWTAGAPYRFSEPDWGYAPLD
jgi:RES domain-containing protein